MTHILQRNLLGVPLLLFCFLISCSSSENTTIIEEAPVPTGQSDTTAQQPQSDTDTFTQITMGENQPIKTLDPLYAENNSSLRALQLVYEGLVRFDGNGEITPAIARQWSVTNNQLTYRFNLHNDLFYHDSNVFANGRGRRLVASDVKRAFERMAGSTVPDRAAQLFMNIEGFEPFYREQHAVLLPDERQLSGISGIQTPNDSTVVFNLVEPDDTFLNKLATPYGVIYPHEAVTNNSFIAVGTGPFRYSQKQSDSLYIFARFDGYRVQNQPRLNRVDIQTSSNETALLNTLNTDDLQLIPQLGPRQMAALLTAESALKSQFTGNHTLYNTGSPYGFHLRYNTHSDQSKASVRSALAAVSNQSYFKSVPGDHIRLLWAVSDSGDVAPADTLVSSYSDNPMVRDFYTELRSELSSSGIHFQMSPIRITTRSISFFPDQFVYFMDAAMRTTPPNTLVSIVVEKIGVGKQRLENVQFNAYPWWINLREASLSTNNR